MNQPRTLFGGLGNRMFQMAYIYAQFKEGTIPDIYLQDYTLWEKYRKEIKAWYSKDLIKEDYISLHVRRGDYINNPFYIDLTATDYYDKAIAEFPNEKFLIFCADRQEGSDDIADTAWCRERFKGDKFSFLISSNEVMDMNAMAGCKGHIMANSSFSWWASFLGEGKTVAPAKWFTDGVERIKLLPEWKIL